MKTLDSGKDKIQKICDELKRETLEPAQKEADRLIHEAHEKAEEIKSSAKAEVEEYKQHARREIEQERNVFESSLDQAVKQGVESLKQKVEEELFNHQLNEIVEEQVSDPKVIANIIQAIVEAVNKEGLSADLTAVASKAASAEEVSKLLLKKTLGQLKEKEVVLGSFGGGAKVKLHNQQLTIDMSGEAFEGLLASFLRDKYRKLLFAG